MASRGTVSTQTCSSFSSTAEEGPLYVLAKGPEGTLGHVWRIPHLRSVPGTQRPNDMSSHEERTQSFMSPCHHSDSRVLEHSPAPVADSHAGPEFLLSPLAFSLTGAVRITILTINQYPNFNIDTTHPVSSELRWNSMPWEEQLSLSLAQVCPAT